VKVRGAAALADSLNGMREDARLYKVLATLRTDVPLGESLSDLEHKGPDEPALARLREKLGDDGLART
jgi:hypothetical protein